MLQFASSRSTKLIGPVGVTAFDLALHKHNSRNLRTLAQFATFAGVFSIKVQGLFRKVIYQRWEVASYMHD